MTQPGEGSKEFYSVQGAGHDQLVDSSWTGWHQGDISSIINLLVSASLGSVLAVSSFHLVGGGGVSASCKNNLGMCIRPLSISFRELGVRVILLCGRIIVYIVASSLAQQLSFVSKSSHFPIIASSQHFTSKDKAIEA